MLTTTLSCFVSVYYNYEDELSSFSESSPTAVYSSMNTKTKSPSITPTTTPQSPCMCNMSDCVCCIHEFMFLLPTAPLVGILPVVVGVVCTGVIIVTVIVVIVCLLIVAKHKHRKNSLGEDEITLLLLLLVFVHCRVLFFFPQLPLTTFIGHHLPWRAGLF